MYIYIYIELKTENNRGLTKSQCDNSDFFIYTFTHKHLFKLFLDGLWFVDKCSPMTKCANLVCFCSKIHIYAQSCLRLFMLMIINCFRINRRIHIDTSIGTSFNTSLCVAFVITKKKTYRAKKNQKGFKKSENGLYMYIDCIFLPTKIIKTFHLFTMFTNFFNVV